MLNEFHAELSQRFYVRGASDSRDFQETGASLLNGSDCHFGVGGSVAVADSREALVAVPRATAEPTGVSQQYS